MEHALDGCWAKVEHGKEHSIVLEKYIKDTFSIEANRPRLGIKIDTTTGEHVLYVSYLPDLSAAFVRISLLLGDILHNLRSALDHMTYQLALWNTRRKIMWPKLVQFPIVDEPSDFDRAIKKELREIDPVHRKVIERFQPYNRIAEGISIGPYFHSFAVLRDLSNTDKHRLLNPIMIPPTSLGPSVSGESFLLFIVAAMETSGTPMKFAPIELGTEVARAELLDGISVPEKETVGYIQPVISFLEGWPVNHVINRIAALTDSILNELKPLL